MNKYQPRPDVMKEPIRNYTEESGGEIDWLGRPKHIGVHAGTEARPYDASKTRQADTPGTDLNLIMARYKSGDLNLADLIRMNEMSEAGAAYGDFTTAPNFQEALNTVIHAQDQFNMLDATTRERFGNDPALFLEFVNNKENREEAKKLGLITERPTETTLGDVKKALDQVATNTAKPTKNQKNDD